MDGSLVLIIVLIVISWIIACLNNWRTFGTIGSGLLWGSVQIVVTLSVGILICWFAYLWGDWVFAVALVLLIALLRYLIMK